MPVNTAYPLVILYFDAGETLKRLPLRQAARGSLTACSWDNWEWS